MWLVYPLAFVLGGGVLLVQMLSGFGHGGHDFGHHALHGPGLLSTRSVTFGLFAFGLVGGPMHILGLAPPLWAFALAAAGGLVSAAAASLAFQVVGHPDASGAAALGEVKGRVARVLVSCGRGQRGKVRVELKGQTVDMMATTDEESVPEGASVRILEVRDDVAHVEVVR